MPAYCPIHGRVLVCPACAGAKGGSKTAKKHAKKLKAWGRKGGKARAAKHPKR